MDEGFVSWGPYYSLTELGGQLWEAERCPDWSRFVSTNSRPFGTLSPNRMSILSPKGSTARKCLGGFIASGLVAPKSRPRFRKLLNYKILYWTTFPEITVLHVRTHPDEESSDFLDWDVYEEVRTWWRVIPEMLTIINDSDN